MERRDNWSPEGASGKYLRQFFRDSTDESVRRAKLSPSLAAIKVTKPIHRRLVYEPPISDTSLLSEEKEEPKPKPKKKEKPVFAPIIPLIIDMPYDFYQVMKTVRVIKTADVTTAVTYLTILNGLEVDDTPGQNALIKGGGLSLLINLLETTESKCQLCSLKVLIKATNNDDMKVRLTNLGIIAPLINFLTRCKMMDILIHSCMLLTQLCEHSRPARIFRKLGGIPPLIDYINLTPETLLVQERYLSYNQKNDLRLGTAAMEVACQLARHQKTVHIMYRAGMMEMLSRAIYTIHSRLLSALMGLLQASAADPFVQESVESQTMVTPILFNMNNQDSLVRRNATLTLAYCCSREVVRHIIRLIDGLPFIMELPDQPRNVTDRPMYIALIRVIAKLTMTAKNADCMSRLGVVKRLGKVLSNEKEDIEIVMCVITGLGHCAQIEANRKAIYEEKLIPTLMEKIISTNMRLVMCILVVLGHCAEDMEGARAIEDLDGIRLIFSLLQNDNEDLLSLACWTLIPCMENIAEAHDVVRSLTGSLLLLMKLLRTQNPEVLANGCCLLSRIVLDLESLAVLIDQGMISALADHCRTTDDYLRVPIAMLVANSCYWQENVQEFGRTGILMELCGYLQSTSRLVHLQTIRALCLLSYDSINCIIILHSGILPIIFRNASLCTDHKLQEACALILANLRRFKISSKERLTTIRDLRKYDYLAAPRYPSHRRKLSIYATACK